MDLEQKILIMIEFVEKEKQPIKYDTVYGEYKIGAWQRYIRFRDRNGKLDISKELRKKCEQLGIIIKNKKRNKTTDQTKYEFILKFQKGEIRNTDKNRETAIAFKRYLQIRYNRKNIDLSEKQIQALKKLGMLNSSSEEKEQEEEKKNQLIQDFGITRDEFNYINNHFGSIFNFIERYKAWEDIVIGKIIIYLQKRGITISSRDITAIEKDRYLKLAGKILRKKHFDRSDYINIDKIDLVLQSLTEEERTLINSYFGLKGEKKKSYKEIAKESGITRQAINLRLEKIIKKYRFKFISNHIYGNYDEDINNRDNLLSQSKINVKPYSEIPVEDLGLSTRSTHQLKLAGINNLNDLIGKSEKQLYEIRGLGEKSVNEIISRLEQIKNSRKQDYDILELQAMISQLNTVILAYEKAYRDFEKIGNIFNPNEIIPASIILKGKSETPRGNNDRKGSLQAKMEGRLAKSRELEGIEIKIGEQQKKELLLEGILQEYGIDTSSNNIQAKKSLEEE